MIASERNFVRKYSFLYTVLVSIILFFPLVMYFNHLVNVKETNTQIKLEHIQDVIIDKMDNFENTRTDIFNFPKFKNYKSMLYTADFKIIYSQIDNINMPSLSGYYKSELNRYVVKSFPNDKYFEAHYILTITNISFYEIYYEISAIASTIIMLILLISFMLFKSFSKPYEIINRKLDNFIQESMHEINTPLSIINLNIDLYESKTNENNKYLSRIKAATRTLSTIYCDMDFLIKHNRIKYEKKDIIIEDFLEARVLYFELICLAKNIKLNFEPCNTKSIIKINDTKLQRILDNTLSNAIKFSNKNSEINVNVSLDLLKNKVYVSIQDNGIGIKDTKIIMEKYYKEEDKVHGFGIGMNIVQSILIEENINLDISSKLNVGSTFKYQFDLIKGSSI